MQPVFHVFILAFPRDTAVEHGRIMNYELNWIELWNHGPLGLDMSKRPWQRHVCHFKGIYSMLFYLYNSRRLNITILWVIHFPDVTLGCVNNHRKATQISDEAKLWTFLESLPKGFFRSQKEDMSGQKRMSGHPSYGNRNTRPATSKPNRNRCC